MFQLVQYYHFLLDNILWCYTFSFILNVEFCWHVRTTTLFPLLMEQTHVEYRITNYESTPNYDNKDCDKLYDMAFFYAFISKACRICLSQHIWPSHMQMHYEANIENFNIIKKTYQNQKLRIWQHGPWVFLFFCFRRIHHHPF